MSINLWKKFQKSSVISVEQHISLLASLANKWQPQLLLDGQREEFHLSEKLEL
jgi:hypothetical protein